MHNRTLNDIVDSPWFQDWYMGRLEKLQKEAEESQASLFNAEGLAFCDYNEKLRKYLSASHDFKCASTDPLYGFDCTREIAKEAYEKFGDTIVASFFVKNKMLCRGDNINVSLQSMLNIFEHENHKAVPVEDVQIIKKEDNLF